MEYVFITPDVTFAPMTTRTNTNAPKSKSGRGRPKTNFTEPKHFHNLLILMERDGVTQADIARALGVTDADVSQRISGKIGLTPERARKLTKKFGWTASEIYDDIFGIRPASVIKVPIRGSVPGGLPMEAIEVPSDRFIYYVPQRKVPAKSVGALQVIGDSMNNVAPEGSYVIVDFSRTNPQDLDGKAIIAYANGECTFKRLCLNPNMLLPDSTNKSHKPIMLKGEWSVLGAVMGVIKTIEED